MVWSGRWAEEAACFDSRDRRERSTITPKSRVGPGSSYHFDPLGRIEPTFQTRPESRSGKGTAAIGIVRAESSSRNASCKTVLDMMMIMITTQFAILSRCRWYILHIQMGE